MNQYVTGSMIKKLRERQGITQLELAGRLSVSDKTVSKWETGRGYPDITLIEPLAAALGISVMELLSGEDIVNTNRSANMKRLKLHVCPVCGNVIASVGEAVVSCCGISLPVLEPEIPDEGHTAQVERVEDEYYVTVAHEMEREHHISFFAAVQDNSWTLVKLYPEGPAEVRFPIYRTSCVYYFCNHHGLFRIFPSKML